MGLDGVRCILMDCGGFGWVLMGLMGFDWCEWNLTCNDDFTWVQVCLCGFMGTSGLILLRIGSYSDGLASFGCF